MALILNMKIETEEDFENAVKNSLSFSGYIRAELSCGHPNWQSGLEQHGFFWCDRTLFVSLPVEKDLPEVMNRMNIRLPVKTITFGDDVRNIAKQVFTNDRRFHLKRNYNALLASEVLEEYFQHAQKVENVILGCHYKDQLTGFLWLTQEMPQEYFVYLAATLPQYRLLGSAVSLYAKAYKTCQTAQVRRLSGRVSSANTAVMNLYTGLGGIFADPYDIYIREAL